MREIKVPVEYNNSELNVSAYFNKRSFDWILCLHGLESNKDLFRDMLSMPYFNKFSILAIDFIGFGNSSKPEDFSYDLNDQATICHNLILMLGIKKVHIIGHSMGGMVGTLLLNSLPEKVSSFVNMEGNLVLEDCGTSKEVGSVTFEEFRTRRFATIKHKIKSSNRRSASYRIRWMRQIPDFVFYKSSVSIVKLSRSKKLLQFFLESPCKKLYMYGKQNKSQLLRPKGRRV